MENSFNAALQQLNGKIEDLRQQKQAAASGTVSSPAAHAEERVRRMGEAHARILNDILAMHRKLATGIDPPTLDALATFLQECVEKVAKERSVPEVMLCCRSSILRRFHHEAGGGAWDEMERQLAAQNEAWPETTQRDPIEEEAGFERRRQLKYREMKNDFVNYELARSAQLIRGIERAWQADYPEPGTPLWRELVLEGVATALRARILQGYYERLLANKEKIVTRATELVGRELGALQAVLAEKNLTSLEDAHRVAITSGRVLDEVIPEIAWQVIREESAGR
ncbi:MAG: hypothetical protein CVU69_11265 [Deltaproteobacteria bacterium HGW-Deltaproteobacteria-4]|nr:MAG: hypothetical protein CVU69_11265 [Deltaproteobacteria bacterium HGW-Deltaproteobacteria-4]